MPTKLLVLQGLLYTVPAALTPVATVLASDTPLTWRVIAGLVVAAIISGSIALKAFLSTTFSESATGVKMREEAEGRMARVGGRAD